MKKTLIILFVVLMTATLFVACSSSPKEDECYDIKFEFENGVNGPLYCKAEATKAAPYSTYKLYTDASCTTESDSTLQFSANIVNNKADFFFKFVDVETEKNWASKTYKEGITVTGSYVTESFKAGTVLKLENYHSDITGDVTATFANDVTFTIERNL